MAIESYRLNIIKAVNGWVVANQGAFDSQNDYAGPKEFLVVPEGGDLGGTINAAIAANKLTGNAELRGETTAQVVANAREALKNMGIR